MIRNKGSLVLNFVVAVALCSVLVFSGEVSAADNIASFQTVKGSVQVLRKGALPAIAAKTGDRLSSGDIVRTKSDSSAEVAFQDGSLLKISPRSRIDMGAYFDGQNKNLANVKLARGRVDTVVSKVAAGRMFEVQTPNAICGVRGTEWFQTYDVDANITGVAVTAGSIYSYNLNNPNNVVTVMAGMHTSIAGNAPPRPPAPGTGSFSGAVPFSYSAASSASAAVSAVMTAPMVVPPPPPPPPPPTPPPSQVRPTNTLVNVTPSFN